MMLLLFTVLTLGRSNDGIFKQRFDNIHSIGKRASLGNCLPYNLDTANKLPTTTVLTKPAGLKKNSMQDGDKGIIFGLLLPNLKKMSWQD